MKGWVIGVKGGRVQGGGDLGLVEFRVVGIVGGQDGGGNQGGGGDLGVVGVKL